MQEKLEFERWLDLEQREQVHLMHQSHVQKGEFLQSMKEVRRLRLQFFPIPTTDAFTPDRWKPSS